MERCHLCTVDICVNYLKLNTYLYWFCSDWICLEDFTDWSPAILFKSMKSVMIEDGKEATCIFLSIYLFIFNLNKLRKELYLNLKSLQWTSAGMVKDRLDPSAPRIPCQLFAMSYVWTAYLISFKSYTSGIRDPSGSCFICCIHLC